MKIIKQGVLPETIAYRATCTHCKTEIEYTSPDVTPTISRDQRDAGTGTIECPLCKHSIHCAFNRS